MDFQKIGFIGLGLIGGSLAKSIKAKYPNTTLIAMASREQTLEMAHKDGVIENNGFIPLTDFSDCDIIFLCSPVKINVEYLQKLKPLLSPNCLISDVGSVKGDITKAVADLQLNSQFVGGHPMAGSESTGYNNANKYLLENAYYILTVTEEFPKDKLKAFDAYLRTLGCLTMIMTPEKHDFATACISHLPHIIAASLVRFVQGADGEDATLKTIAAGGFRDITRIASSSPIMWQHICSTNRQEILNAFGLYEQSLREFITSVENCDEETMFSLFSSAKDYRDNLPVKKKGVLPSAYEFYLDIADETGGIATIATILAENNINIKNIGIVHNREFEQGVLRIELYTQDKMEQAIAILEKDYTVHK
ncbi:MAG: prephenate dehydrogenase [Lachnospiraceae bacterium]|nr:prephenate dehydrogenase [Lachnospiraceae bacterium]